MHEHDEDSRVEAPRNDQNDANVMYGRQLAMDSILQDECRGMMAATGGESAGSLTAKMSSRRRVLWVGACIAASILGMWTILWGTGALRPGMDTSSASVEADDLANRESPQILTAPPSKKNGEPSASNPDLPAKPATQQNPTKRKGPSKESRGEIANVVPESGVKLKGLDIPEPDAKGKISIPASADPADIRLIRSAVAMFEAEARLAKKVKAGLIEGIDQMLSFDEIASWPYEDGLKGMPTELKKLDGKKVLMTGFMLPIDDVENIKEFLLVESLWSCCYGQPPDINGTVRVVLKGSNRTDYMFDPIKLVGTFRIEPTVEDGFCVDVFQLEVERVEVIE